MASPLASVAVQLVAQFQASSVDRLRMARVSAQWLRAMDDPVAWRYAAPVIVASPVELGLAQRRVPVDLHWDVVKSHGHELDLFRKLRICTVTSIGQKENPKRSFPWVQANNAMRVTRQAIIARKNDVIMFREVQQVSVVYATHRAPIDLALLLLDTLPPHQIQRIVFFVCNEWPSSLNGLVWFLERLQDGTPLPDALDIHVSEAASLLPSGAWQLEPLLKQHPSLHVTVWCPQHEAGTPAVRTLNGLHPRLQVAFNTEHVSRVRRLATSARRRYHRCRILWEHLTYVANLMSQISAQLLGALLAIFLFRLLKPHG
jgi:hypothetical protein